jgi:hypothetical protein
MVKEKYLILLIIYCNDNGKGVNLKMIEMFSLPFKLGYENRYKLLEDLEEEGYLFENNDIFSISQLANILLKESNIDSILGEFLTEKSKVTLEFLLTKWKEGNKISSNSR